MREWSSRRRIYHSARAGGNRKNRLNDDVGVDAVTTRVAPADIIGDAELPPTLLAEQYMGMPAQRQNRRWTEAEFYAARDAAPAGERWELVDGEVLVTPSPHW